MRTRHQLAELLRSFEIDAQIFGVKACTVCGQALPVNGEHFDQDQHRPDGLKAACKRCCARRGSDYYRRVRRQQR
jgi:hypothetical protein